MSVSRLLYEIMCQILVVLSRPYPSQVTPLSCKVGYWRERDWSVVAWKFLLPSLKIMLKLFVKKLQAVYLTPIPIPVLHREKY